MGTCLPLVMRTSQQGLQEVLLCREGFLCPSPTQHQKWTWPQRLPSPLSPSIPPLSQPLTYQRPTTSHAKRSMPKKLGQARNPPLHYSSNQFLKAADFQVTSRYIRDCDLEEVVSFTFFIGCYLLSLQKRHHSFPVVCCKVSSILPNQPETSLVRFTANKININSQNLSVHLPQSHG